MRKTYDSMINLPAWLQSLAGGLAIGGVLTITGTIRLERVTLGTVAIWSTMDQNITARDLR